MSSALLRRCSSKAAFQIGLSLHRPRIAIDSTSQEEFEVGNLHYKVYTLQIYTGFRRRLRAHLPRCTP